MWQAPWIIRRRPFLTVPIEIRRWAISWLCRWYLIPGITNYALALRYMEGWKGTEFLRRTKNHYKGVKVLSGYPGDHAAILRYTEDEYLIGVITSPKKKVVSVT